MISGDPSHFLDYIGTNDAPSAEALKDLDKYLAGPVQEVQKLDAEIDEITDRLSALYSERAKLTTTLKSRQSICSLVRRLPDEILGEIFIRCLPSEHLPELNFADAPLLLTMICQRWRDVAILIPPLWSSLHLTVAPHGEKMDSEGKFELARRYINRAGSLPLSLSVFEVDEELSSEGEEITPFLQHILELLPRTKLLHWKVRWSVGPHHLFRRLEKEAFSQLEEVKVKWRWSRSTDPKIDGIPSFLLGPRLQVLELLGGELPFTVADPLPSQWKRLTGLTIRHEDTHLAPDINSLARILQHCPCLRTCAVNLQGVQPSTVNDFISPGPRVDYVATPDHTERSIFLPFLHKLHLYYSGFVGDFIKRLYVPNIKELGLTDDHSHQLGFRYPSAGLAAFVTYHEYCLPSIEKLEVQTKYYDYLVIVESLEKLNGLRHLVIADSNVASTEKWDPVNLTRNCGFHQDMLVRMTPKSLSTSSCGSAPSRDSPVTSSQPSSSCLCPLLERFDYLELDNYLYNQQVLLTLDVVLAWVSAKWDASQEYPGLVSPMKHITFPTSTSPERKWKNALKLWRKNGLIVEIAYPYRYENRLLEKAPQYQGADQWLD